MSQIPIGYYSMKVLQEPVGCRKGALILSQVDSFVKQLPFLKERFYLIERRGWEGLNESLSADIKLVEDLSFWEETRTRFPKSICLDIGPADFVDVNAFRPLGISKIYDGIQASHWSDFKRPALLIQAAAILRSRKFLKLGHFEQGGSSKEYEFRDTCIELAKSLNASIDFPYSDAVTNSDFPGSTESINVYINIAKLGILTTKVEGINRFKMECLSAGIPVLVPSDSSYPTKKHINSRTGGTFHPTATGLADAIEEALSNYASYDTRDYIMENTGKPIALSKLKGSLSQLSERENISCDFSSIDWDGRNQSLTWGEKAIEDLRNYA